MGDLAKRLAESGRKSDRPQRDNLPKQEKKVLRIIQREAKDKGTSLKNGGKGGLPPSLVLGVFRRDDYACACNTKHGIHDERDVCGARDDITLHHLGGIAKNKWLSKMGHANERKNIITICDECHNLLHEKARERGDDSSQVLPEGDEGGPRDDGDRPLAKPKE